MTGHQHITIRNIYVAYIFMLIAFAGFSYIYQHNLNKREDEIRQKSEVADIAGKRDEKAPSSAITYTYTNTRSNGKGEDAGQKGVPRKQQYCVYIGKFESLNDAEGFFSSQDQDIIRDLSDAYNISFEEDRGFFYIVLGYLDSYELAQNLGERLKKHFNVQYYRILEL